MSANNYLFSGSIVAIVTPMDSSGEIDFVRLKSLVNIISQRVRMRLSQ